jgi:hypothetical protein
MTQRLHLPFLFLIFLSFSFNRILCLAGANIYQESSFMGFAQHMILRMFLELQPEIEARRPVDLKLEAGEDSPTASNESAKASSKFCLRKHIFTTLHRD